MGEEVGTTIAELTPRRPEPDGAKVSYKNSGCGGCAGYRGSRWLRELDDGGDVPKPSTRALWLRAIFWAEGDSPLAAAFICLWYASLFW